MADEYVIMDEALTEIDRVESDREAIKVATRTLGRVLLAILEELREQRDA